MKKYLEVLPKEVTSVTNITSDYLKVGESALLEEHLGKAFMSHDTFVRLKAGLEKTRVFLKKPSPVGFFGFFWVFLGFLGFFGFFWVFLPGREGF